MLRLGIALQVWMADRRDRGATAVEYALIIAGVAAVIATVVWAFADVVDGIFNDACNGVIRDAADAAECADLD